jgi:hypothetical protein
MSIISEFEVFLAETVCCFRYCISVVSVVLVVRLDSFGTAWHLSLQDRRQALPNESNLTTSTTETTDM